MDELSKAKKKQTLSVCILSDRDRGDGGECTHHAPSPPSNDIIQSLEGVADELVTAAAPSEDAPRPHYYKNVPLDRERGISMGYVANQLIGAAASEWILIMYQHEKLPVKNEHRLAYLLRHPIKPCYEFPVHYGTLFSINVETREVATLPHRYELRLFRKDALLSFGETLEEVRVADQTTLSCRPMKTGVELYHPSSAAPPEAEYNRSDLIRRIYERITVRFPNDYRGFQSLGTFYYSMGEIPSAIDALSVAMKLCPTSPPIINSLGYLYMEQGDFQRAMKIWTEGIKISPEFHILYANMGVLFMRLRQLKNASSMFRKTLRLKPDHAVSYYNLGVCCAELGQLDDAILSFKACTRYEPTYVNAYVALSQLLETTKRFEEALGAAENALRIDPSHEAAAVLKGRLAAQVGNENQEQTSNEGEVK